MKTWKFIIRDLGRLWYCHNCKTSVDSKHVPSACPKCGQHIWTDSCADKYRGITV